jgi:hypothetical protein
MCNLPSSCWLGIEVNDDAEFFSFGEPEVKEGEFSAKFNKENIKSSEKGNTLKLLFIVHGIVDLERVELPPCLM